MTREAEAAAPEVDVQIGRRNTDLLGIAYLGTMAVVMTAWIGSLIWAASQVAMWLMS